MSEKTRVALFILWVVFILATVTVFARTFPRAGTVFFVLGLVVISRVVLRRVRRAGA